MTREDAYNRIDAIIAKYEIDDEYVTITNSKDYDALRIARKVLEQQPCENCISRQAVLDEAFEVDTKEYGRIDVVGVDAIDALSPVTPQSKTGRWINNSCSECGIYNASAYKSYCPNCGCCMVEPQESEG